ncbi:hypothetical protein Salat_0711900 [Sesamum alatum]|uniref:Uncharacterized protein n=1 Tax=Sesamum alatum TaxID=300844 RepID=A0AAE2CUZ6_9LAMI|nr:hypothetical protein Salat_0711900 [Sesamum alatum]
MVGWSRGNGEDFPKIPPNSRVNMTSGAKPKSRDLEATSGWAARGGFSSRQPRAAVPRARASSRLVPRASSCSSRQPRAGQFGRPCLELQLEAAPARGSLGRPCQLGAARARGWCHKPGGPCLELGYLHGGRGSGSRHLSASSLLQHPGLRPGLMSRGQVEAQAGQFGRPCLELPCFEPGGPCLELGYLRGEGLELEALQHPGFFTGLMSRGQVEAQPWGGCCIRWDLNSGQKDGSK